MVDATISGLMFLEQDKQLTIVALYEHFHSYRK